MQTKASALSRGEYSITKWDSWPDTKAVSDTVGSSVYCVTYSNNPGCAVLAADRRQAQKIFCIVDDDEITAGDLEVSKRKLFSEESKVGTKAVGARVEQQKIGGCDESLATDIVCLATLKKKSTSQNVVQRIPSSSKYGPLLKTKWGQGKPFNDQMNGVIAGCIPVATAQLIYYYNDKLNPYQEILGKRYYWTILGTVMNYTLGTAEAQEQASYFMLDVKWKCNMHTYETTGIVSGVEDCIRQFGFKNVYHDFAHFGGDGHDMGHLKDVIKMIKDGKPVVMLAFCAEGWPWDWCGHAYVIDGYKSDTTGEYLHINWGWNGSYDGYYAVGCFNVGAQSGIEEGFDTNTTIDDFTNFELCHYYVHYEI